MMAKQIYRKEALGRLASPEQLDKLMPVTHPRGWIALGAAGLVLLMAMAWSVLGTIARTVEGHGVLRREGGITTVQAVAGSRVSRLLVRTGDAVEQGQDLLYLAPPQIASQGNPFAVVSPCTGRVGEIDVYEGEIVAEGAPLLTVESMDRPLQAVVYLPTKDGYQVETGMKVQVFPVTTIRQDSGCLAGQVRTAARFPSTRAAMVRVLRDEVWVDSFLRTGPVLEVAADLSGQDAFEELYSGTPCRALITVEKNRPLELVFPGLWKR